MGIPDTLNEQALRHVDRMSQSARHLLYLIDELSSFARLEAGRSELHVQDVNVRAIVYEVGAVVQPLADERGLAFQVDVPQQPLIVRTDPDRLRQVLLNLVGNALKYTEQGEARIEMRAAPDGGAVFLVRDTGIGISPEHIDRIFEPFWQADATQRANQRGTGLGLSIVRRLLFMLNGEITVQSEPGQGSTFTVRLPAHPPG
jgi:signal transduction histidine kinase